MKKYLGIGLALMPIAFAAPAHADQVAVIYAETYSAAICSTLDEYPTFNGIIGIAQVMMDDGMTGTQAGEAMYLSVASDCPWHEPLLLRFGRYYGSESRSSTNPV